MREFLRGLELDKETIDTIMAEYGKNVQGLKEEKETLKTKINEYETQINDLSSKAETNENTQKELEMLKAQIAERKLNDTIISAIGDKKFVNEFTKKAVIDEIKKGLNDEKNKGKSVNDILTAFTTGKEGIFVEENNNNKATGMQNKNNSVPEDDGVMAILKAKHPEINF